MTVLVFLFGPVAQNWLIYARFRARGVVIFVVQWWIGRELQSIQRRDRRIRKVMRLLEGWIQTL
ncbi:hypothetical protein [Gluconobacter kondonii]|uniref:hypothetical protein n=1 Tax=Gluconobacter kondonii TaxID=941463 RepID=UPI00197F03EC|nr:hypothetical protein [Gluconobacter kondonii]MBN3866432.1 hypothetical protein [Gluconobacter kondonii]